MDQILEFILKLFDTTDWPARWNCGTWSDFHGWLYILSDLGIWGAYFTIPFILMYFIQKRTEVPFKPIVWLFILFILFCGATHLIDAAIFYTPIYRFSALIRFFTAIVSWMTVFALIRNMPQIIALRTPRELEKIVHLRTSELKETASFLQMRISQLENFAEITSHNLRSPLGNLVALVTLYERAQDPQEKIDLIHKMKTVSNKMMQTVDDLASVVLNTRTEELVYEDNDLEQMTKGISETLTEDFLRTGVQLITDFKRLPVISYQKSYLESILLNLVTNAIKYRDPQKSSFVKIISFRDRGIDTLVVEDNGLGINLNRFGSKLFKLHKTFHRNEDARGVGLFITKNQIESLGGTIDVQSEERKGTTFTIRFNALKTNYDE